MKLEGRKRYLFAFLVCLFFVFFLFPPFFSVAPFNDCPDREIPSKEILKHVHCAEKDLWLVIANKVYDVSNFIEKHPGGKQICRGSGIDATKFFDTIHADFVRTKELPKYCIGYLINNDKMPEVSNNNNMNTFVDGWHDKLPPHTHAHENGHGDNNHHDDGDDVNNNVNHKNDIGSK